MRKITLSALALATLLNGANALASLDLSLATVAAQKWGTWSGWHGGGTELFTRIVLLDTQGPLERLVELRQTIHRDLKEKAPQAKAAEDIRTYNQFITRFCHTVNETKNPPLYLFDETSRKQDCADWLLATISMPATPAGSLPDR